SEPLRAARRGPRGGRHRRHDPTRSRRRRVPRADRRIRQGRVHARVRAPDRLRPKGVPRVRQARAGPQALTLPAPEPERIYEETKKEGERRLARPPIELAATALVGGFDVAIGVAAYALAARTIAGSASELVGSIAFGIGFVFIVVGRSELFTENFLIKVAGVEWYLLSSWFKLGEALTDAYVF